MKQSILEEIKARRAGHDPHVIKRESLGIPHPCKMYYMNGNRIIYLDCPIGTSKNGERQDCPNSQKCNIENGEVVIGGKATI